MALGVNIMSPVQSPNTPSHGLRSPIVSKLINVRGDDNVLARFVRFSGDSVINVRNMNFSRFSNLYLHLFNLHFTS